MYARRERPQGSMDDDKLMIQFLLTKDGILQNSMFDVAPKALPPSPPGMKTDQRFFFLSMSLTYAETEARF